MHTGGMPTTGFDSYIKYHIPKGCWEVVLSSKPDRGGNTRPALAGDKASFLLTARTAVG